MGVDCKKICAGLSRLSTINKSCNNMPTPFSESYCLLSISFRAEKY